MYQINFTFNSEKISFVKKNVLSLYMEILNWLHDNNYSFKGRIHEKFIRKIHTIDEINNIVKINNSYRLSDFYNISDSGNFIYRGGNINKIYPNILMMLENFGIDKSTIKTEGFETQTRIKKFGEINDDTDDTQEEVESIDFSKNPFGGVENSSAVCILGKSGSGKSTSTEIALEEMGHEYELMLAIDGEYTFSQYNGQNFEMSSFGEFLMRAQNDPKKCYTAIFDECHRPITINKINTDLLQALSRKRNRDGKRFITMDRSTKRMYTTPNEEFPIAMTEERGKILIPDNFGIICLSSNAAIICRNDDFLNRVDLIIFHQSDRDIKDLTQLKKLEPNDKNIETIRGLLLNDGKSEL